MTAASAGAWLDAMRQELAEGCFVGRVWDPAVAGPSPVLITADGVFDLSRTHPTMRAITELDDPAAAVRGAAGQRLCSVETLVANSWHRDREGSLPHLLCPFDLQVIKAAGVTFVTSMVERVIEERAGGDADAAAGVRAELQRTIGTALSAVRPGSSEAREVRRVLADRGLWSQYLEVGLGPDAEIFTKAPVLSSVGYGAEVGISEISSWNNPEPELVIAVSSAGRAVGATLGNDVNLRDVEGRSALLLPRAKDNNASSSLGPWIRLFDDSFALDDVSRATITLTVTGADGFELTADAEISQISRSIPELLRQLAGRHHQYPDGAALFLGTPFAPVVDRGAEGDGFTHHVGDTVTIAWERIGALANEVNTSEACPPWTDGIHQLMVSLARRGLLAPLAQEGTR